MRVLSYCRTAGLMLLGLSTLGLSSCCFFSSEKPEPAAMTASIDLGEVHRCSKISPEIVIAAPPAGTGYYEVRLNRVSPEPMFLGGGTWGFNGLDEDGLDRIAEGGLTSHYRGPCPRGRAETYVYSVQAMPKDGGAPLAETSVTLNLE